MASVGDVGGLSERHVERLRSMGIRTSDDLLDYGAGRRGRRELSKVTRLGEKRIKEWIKRADLLRVPGVSTRYSDLLEAVGVDTVRDLRRRNPAKLHAQLIAMNDRRQVVKRTPTGADVEAWVEGAKDLPDVIRRR